MGKPSILLHVDCDKQASTFDSIVALDAGVQQVITRSDVQPLDIQGLIHGAMFTRGPADLKNTAVFFGGSDVSKTDSLFAAARACFFGPMRVSLMSDPNGCNTTAAAAVLAAQRHADLTNKRVVILGATGPVGQRIAQIIVGLNLGGELVVCSRHIERAQAVVDGLSKADQASEAEPQTRLSAAELTSADAAFAATKTADFIFSASAAGVEMLDQRWRETNASVLLDLNAVPPAGIAGIEPTAAGKEVDGKICYGAIGVGELKMKIHKRAIQSLFESNDQVLDTQAIYQIGAELLAE